MQDVIEERQRYGARIEGGVGSVRAETLALAAMVGACLPSEHSERLEVRLERQLLLLTCAGLRGEGISLDAAAELITARHGKAWTRKRCERLLYRALAEMRGRMEAKGLLAKRG